MFSSWPIRKKLLFACAQLLAVLALLAYGSFHGVYAYRSLVKGLSSRAAELPLAADLSRRVSDLRVIAAELHATSPAAEAQDAVGSRFADCLSGIVAALAAYRAELMSNESSELPIRDSHREWQTVHKIEQVLDELTDLAQPATQSAEAARIEQVHRQLQRLQSLASELPSNLHQRIGELARDVRGQYRTWIILAWIASVLAAITLVVLVRLTYRWVFRPLRSLVNGARRISAGEFSYRIRLETRDEMAELAAALNEAVARFESIRDDLDRQVQQRTRQVVRSEQLASVGFLAAGVAHEINNPLASIAMCAESLEHRLKKGTGSEHDTHAAGPDDDLVHSYLRMIQTEAFRCKEITERLLDFARLGESKRLPTDLAELVQGVIDMVGHLGKYQSKRIEFAPAAVVVAPVNPQEIKQVVLNLLTNALDSLDEGGLVRIELARHYDRAVLTFTDNGCGLSDEVREHLFEPFFTRRRHGQGVGLGLSITYRIVTDHGGQLEATSDGPGHGSRFAVTLPLVESEKELCHRYQAA